MTINIDEKLISQAKKITGLKTKKSVVNFALEEFCKKFSDEKFIKLTNKNE